MSQEFLDLLANADPSANGEAELLVDTNVMLEIYSVGALLRLGDELKTPEAALQSPKYQFRQLRARHSTILAWWLAHHQKVVGNLGNEFVDQLQLMAPKGGPGEDATAFIFTTAIVRVVVPLVLRTFKNGALSTVNHHAKGTNADTEILEQARNSKVPLITNEGLTEAGYNDDPKKLRGRAKGLGVTVYSPKEYLDAQGVDIPAEARAFIEACRQAVTEAKAKGVLDGHEVLDDLVPLYGFVLLDEVNAEHAHIKRPS